MSALVGGEIGSYRLDDNFTIPICRPDTVLCRVRAVALYPVDAKLADYSANPGALGGHDFAGDIVEVGEKISRFTVGDRIFAMTVGLNPSDSTSGAFGDYALATADLACKIPEGMSYEEAASLGVSLGTAGAALFQMLRFPLSRLEDRKRQAEKVPVLVSGGATSTGTIAIQLLKLAGFVPIATCSQESSDLVRSRGAVAIFDYHSPSCGTKIRSWTNNSLEFVLDCVTTVSSMKMCYESIGSSGGQYIALDPFPTIIQYSRRDVIADWLMACTLSGEPVKLAGVYGRPGSPESREFAARFFVLAEELLERRLIMTHPLQRRGGGLCDIPSGIDDLRMGKIRGQKLVYTLT
ncbi:GroES-like protein [Xylaria arbuscula]|nr:GroES-like protein [Xylaria arbuscula]